MLDRMLLALDEYESGQAALRFTKDLAAVTGNDVRVLHIRALSKWARVPPLETPAQAEALVDEAVFTLRFSGLGAEGRFCSLPEDQMALRIVEESLSWLCDAIVLGTRRLRGIGRLSGRGVRERVLRLSPSPTSSRTNALDKCHSLSARARRRLEWAALIHVNHVAARTPEGGKGATPDWSGPRRYGTTVSPTRGEAFWRPLHRHPRSMAWNMPRSTSLALALR